jgi:hypothetical protein
MKARGDGPRSCTKERADEPEGEREEDSSKGDDDADDGDAGSGPSS